jgi:FKBP-type peptidyl-prolyl cis-trans isomerase
MHHVWDPSTRDPYKKHKKSETEEKVIESVQHAKQTMGVTKEVLQAGDGRTFPKKGDHLVMHYQ